MTKTQTTVLFVYFEYDYVDVSTDGSELRRMFNLLGPREVADMDKSVYAFFQFYEDTEVGEVANLSGMLASNRIFHLDGFPWIFFELLNAEAHLALFAIKRQDNSFYLITNVHELLCGA